MILFHDNVADVNTQMNVNMLYVLYIRKHFCVFTLDLHTELADSYDKNAYQHQWHNRYWWSEVSFKKKKRSNTAAVGIFKLKGTTGTDGTSCKNGLLTH